MPYGGGANSSPESWGSILEDASSRAWSSKSSSFCNLLFTYFSKVRGCGSTHDDKQIRTARSTQISRTGRFSYCGSFASSLKLPVHMFKSSAGVRRARNALRPAQATRRRPHKKSNTISQERQLSSLTLPPSACMVVQRVCIPVDSNLAPPSSSNANRHKSDI